jgi:hypothetical protein
MPSISKKVRFQCQAFPRNVLAIFCDFKGLHGCKPKIMFLQIFVLRIGREGPPACAKPQSGWRSGLKALSHEFRFSERENVTFCR